MAFGLGFDSDVDIDQCVKNILWKIDIVESKVNYLIRLLEDKSCCKSEVKRIGDKSLGVNDG